MRIVKIVERKINERNLMLDVFAEMEDGSVQKVVSYYDDEISFTDEELIGLTKDECRDLYFQKDKEYLQS